MSKRTALVLVASLVSFSVSTPAQAACSDASNLCMEPVKGARWEPDKSVSAKQLKAKRKGPPGKLSVTIEGGRGSVFVDGRYAGTAPLGDLDLGPGKHDLQVRDGDKILAEGIITIPKAASVSVTVKHP